MTKRRMLELVLAHAGVNEPLKHVAQAILQTDDPEVEFDKHAGWRDLWATFKDYDENKFIAMVRRTA